MYRSKTSDSTSFKIKNYMQIKNIVHKKYIGNVLTFNHYSIERNYNNERQ